MTQANRLKIMFAVLLVAAVCIVGGIQTGKWLAQRNAPHSAPPAPSYTQVDNSRFMHGAANDVVLYTQAGCVASPKVVQWLDGAGISYEERIVERSNRHWHDIQAMQPSLMPVLLTRSVRIEGFDPRMLSAHLPGNKEE